MRRTTTILQALLLTHCLLAPRPAAAQDDPVRDLFVDRFEPIEGAEGVHFLGSYDGLRSIGQVDLSITIPGSGDFYVVSGRFDVEVDQAGRKIEITAKVGYDLLVREYRHVDMESERYSTVQRIQTIEADGQEWVVRSVLKRMPRELVLEEKETRLPVEVGTLPAGLASFVPLFLYRQAAGTEYAFQLIDDSGSARPATYKVVGEETIRHIDQDRRAILVRLRQSVVRRRPDGREGRARMEVTEFFVSKAGELLQIRSPGSSTRHLAVEDGELGKDLELAFDGNADENGQSPQDVLMALFEAMEAKDEAAIDARVDYEQLFYYFQTHQPSRVTGQDGRTHEIRLPRKVLRQMWNQMPAAHTADMRGSWFNPRMVPVGKEFEVEIADNTATMTRGGNLKRVWILSRASGSWRVVGYEE